MIHTPLGSSEASVVLEGGAEAVADASRDSDLESFFDRCVGQANLVRCSCSSLRYAAWLLNLRGDDIPFNPVFHSYLFVGLESAILFIEPQKISGEVESYLQSISVSHRDYNDIWTFLRRKEWGEGNVRYIALVSCFVSLTPCFRISSRLKPHVRYVS